ncbi:hypothetical protein FIBSPDRAFT_35555 [Athelia psychrophila]|uniref:DUF6699 domain-containing protein n=1 Tax=Athelia psychrophila TaxID=1759441 RepID=A0A166FRF0_9AGAM|nr:hypothetical protein FIBSPDRAFT_35555 [Fibularhizoctonia sp. CBS 109695]
MDMPPLMARPPSPNGWAGSTAAGWGGPAPAWASSSNTGWGNQDWAGPSNTAAPEWADTSNNAAAGWGVAAGGAWPAAGGEDAGERWGTGGQASVSASIPPPPGATYIGNPNHISSWANQTSQPTAENLWAGHTPAFPSAATWPAQSTPAPMTSSSTYPSTAYPPGWAPHSAPAMQASASFPPNPYGTPSWTAAMNMNQHSAPTSPLRPNDLSRSTSWGAYAHSPASTLGRTSNSGGRKNDGNGALPDRPSEWRKDYSARSGLGALLPRGMHRSSRSVGDSSYHRLHEFIRHASSEPPVTWDLRTPPAALAFRDVRREIMASDLMRFACEPPVPAMRLLHPRLPWYIDVAASNPTGVTLWDLFAAMWTALRLPIAQRDFWNEEMRGKERDKIASAWRERCGNDEGERASGVKRVDYLRRDVIFEGLVKGRNGNWEMKTRKLVMGD